MALRNYQPSSWSGRDFFQSGPDAAFGGGRFASLPCPDFNLPLPVEPSVVYRDLEAAVNAFCLVGGALAVIWTSSGQFAVASGCSGRISAKASLFGSADGRVIVTANLSPVIAAIGAIAGDAGIAGALERVRFINIVGEIDAGAGVIADLGMLYSLAALCEVAAAAAASLRPQRSVAGRVEATLTLATPLMGRRRRVEGDVAAQTAITGVMLPYMGLTGEVDGSSHADGALTAVWRVAGLTAAQATVHAQMGVERQVRGEIAIYSDASGFLRLERTLAGVIASFSALDAEVRRTILIGGMAEALSGLSGTMKPVRNVSGEIEAEPAARGRMLAHWALGSLVEVKAEPQGFLRVRRLLQGQVAALLAVLKARLDYAAGPEYLDAELTLRRAVADLGLEAPEAELLIHRLLYLPTAIERTPEVEVWMREDDAHQAHTR